MFVPDSFMFSMRMLFISFEDTTLIFKIEIVKRTEAPKLDNYSTYANTLKSNSVNSVNSAVYNALKEAAEIKDKRATFY